LISATVPWVKREETTWRRAESRCASNSRRRVRVQSSEFRV